MSYLQKYVRQVRPRNESYTPPIDKIQSFLNETSLGPKVLTQPAGQGPNSGRPRIEIFVDKMSLKGKPFKNCSISTWFILYS